MDETRSYDASNEKRIKCYDNGGVAPWSDLNHDVLFLVMMRLGVVDFSAFSVVCKSWRSLALFNRNRFMAHKPPMYISISNDANEIECCLEDFEGRKIKTLLPHSASWSYVGLTCGYLVFYGDKSKDFWLVNPFTRHQLHFPCVPFQVDAIAGVRAILVSSPSINGLVFVMLNRCTGKIWFSVFGKGTWNLVSSTFHIVDLHAFKGKIYALDSGWCLYEIRLALEPKLMVFETNNFPYTALLPEFISTGESLCLMQYIRPGLYLFVELDCTKMKWVCLEETRRKYAFFHNNLRNIVAVKPELWAGADKTVKHRVNDAKMLLLLNQSCGLAPIKQ